MNFWTFLQSNQLIGGGIVLAIIGSFIAALRNVPQKLYALIKDRFTVTVEIRDEQVFALFAEWLAAERYGKECRRMSVELERNVETNPGERSVPRLIFSPGRGLHLFRHGGKLCWLERLKEDSTKEMFPREYMQLRMWGTDGERVRRIFQEAVEFVARKNRGRSIVFGGDGYNGWEAYSSGKGRPLESVVLREGLLKEIVQDAEQFLHQHESYDELGIPYRRGYLLHGPPGCGKSSLVGALAAYLHVNLYLLTMSNHRLNDEDLMNMVRKTLPGSIILVEDIDAIFLERHKAEDVQSRITFSGLLNIIDGVAAQQGRMFFFTTNHLELLDAALIRPGRVDVLRELSYCDMDQARRLWLRFFPEQPELAEEFADRSAGRAPCELQQELLSLLRLGVDQPSSFA